MQSPTTAEGLPTDPSGIWIDFDTTLETGMRALALSHGRWHRTVIVGTDGDYAEVHFIG